MEARLAPVLELLKAGREPDPASLRQLAADPLTRSSLYEALARRGHESVFPGEFRTQEALAESDLVQWLSHPNELRGAPDEIELVKVATVPTDEVGPVRWYLFRFRVRPPHWAADKGWMAGAAGPYRAADDAPPVARSPAPWSELESFSARSADQHATAIHQAAVARGALDALRAAPQKAGVA
jgi:hypothetical protein